jgi:hypothetical protein
MFAHCVSVDLQSACKLRLTGIKDELKHVEKEFKKNAPELKNVNVTLILRVLVL